MTELMIPNPQKPNQKFFNEVTSILYESSFDLMDIHSFKNCVSSQRMIRWILFTEKNRIYSLNEQLELSKNGKWDNVRKFTSEGFQLKAADYFPATKSKEFLYQHLQKIFAFRENIQSRKNSLFDKNMTIVAWRANEFEFYATILGKVKTIESRLATLPGSIEFILQTSKGAVSLQDARIKDQKRVERRTRENKTKSVKEKAVRLKNSSCAVLEIICDDGRFMENVKNNDVSCNIERVDINEKKLVLLSQRFHLNGLRNLLKKSAIGESAREVMETVLKVSTQLQNQAKKARKEGKKANAKKQCRLDTFFKT